MKPKKKISPPPFLLTLFKWFCKPEYHFDIEGDLLELFAKRLRHRGNIFARWCMFIDIILLFRPGIIRPLIKISQPIIYPAMFRHQMLITYRSFLRDKSTYLINLIGLSTGLACVLFILLWVQDELNIDTFHEKNDQLYQVMETFNFNDQIETYEDTRAMIAQYMPSEIPGIEDAVVTSADFSEPEGIFTYGDRTQAAVTNFGSTNFFQVLTYPLIRGKAEDVLANQQSIVLSKELAIKLFSSVDSAIGKILDWQYYFDGGTYNETVEVTGVFTPPPKNATEQFDAVVHFDLLIKADRWAGEWSGGYAKVFLVLEKGINVDQFNQQIEGYLMTKLKDVPFSVHLSIRPYADKYLYNQYEGATLVGGRIAYVRLFSITALIILIIACINFMNLSTAQASKKMKEIGVKKVIGASRQNLIWQFLNASILLTGISFLLALGIVYYLLPYFNVLTAKTLYLDINLPLVLSLLGLLLLTGFVAGSYPAIYLSALQPVTVLKGKLFTSSGEEWTRKGLVIFQFVLSVILLVSVFIIDQQLDYIQNKHLGYDRDHVLSFKMASNNKNPDVFLSELAQIPGVIHASHLPSNLLVRGDNQSGYMWSGDESEREIVFQAPRISYGVIETLGMELIEGRTFSREFQDDYSKIIISESAQRFMGLEHPVGTKIKYGPEEREIIGVVKDFQYGSIHHKMEPIIFRFRINGDNVLAKIKTEDVQQTITSIEELYQEFQAGVPFDWSFMDDDYQALYRSEIRMATLSKFFSGLAIIISCLGLFGLAAFTVERRQKEIGIRKVLGASISQLLGLLSAEFTKMVLVGIAIAIPISYFLAQHWLEGFAYKFDLNVWLFLVAAVITLAIAWLTVSVQTFKTVRLNPVESLKDE